jgi:hypothetical protein
MLPEVSRPINRVQLVVFPSSIPDRTQFVKYAQFGPSQNTAVQHWEELELNDCVVSLDSLLESMELEELEELLSVQYSIPE